MQMPRNRKAKTFYKIPFIAFSLAAFSIVCALSIGLFAYKTSVIATERNYHQFYLRETQLLVKAAEIQKNSLDEDNLTTIRKLWRAMEGKPDDEYICIVDKDAKLTLHTAAPESVGNYAGENLILGNQEIPPTRLSDLVKSQRDYVGDYISSAGEKQLAAFSAVPGKKWVIGLHRSKAELMKNIKAGMRFSKYGFLIICGVLMPLSWILIYFTFHAAQKKRIQAENGLIASEERYRILFEQAPDAIFLEDMDDRIIDVNPSACKLMGYTQDELLLMEVSELHAPEALGKEGGIVRGEHEKHMGVAFEGLNIHQDGHRIPVEIKTVQTSQNGLFLSIVRDISERKRTEKILRKSEKRYRLLADNVTDVIWILDISRFQLKYVSPSVQRLLGFTPEEYLKRSLDEILTPHSFKLASEMITEELETEAEGKDDPLRSRTIELEEYCKDGSTVWVEATATFMRNTEGQPISILGVSRDISERKLAESEKRKLEIQLQQAQKMESIGTLAGGIAHDFNNILSAVIGYTELALNHIEKDSSLFQNLQEVLRAGRRASDLVKQILTFSRQAEQERKPVQVSLITKEALKFLRASLPTTIEIHQDIQSDSLVMADPTQIHQVLMNLCTNAEHAMRSSGGTLKVMLLDVEFTVDFAAGNPELNPGTYIKLSVSDTGSGIPPQLLDRIFDPFFTTKQKGEGTGMGLAVVHGVVGSIGGSIKVTAKPGEGTTFDVFFPAIENHQQPTSVVEASIPTGTERILFVDDELALVNIGKQTLESLGYSVTTRTSSIEALELFRAKLEKFDLVITDMTMPHMTGDELAKEIIHIRPDMPIVLCTGYSARINQQQALEMGIRAFVSKPVVKRQIAESIRQVLDGKEN
jgi:PAS domain S-box-containing protein